MKNSTLHIIQLSLAALLAIIFIPSHAKATEKSDTCIKDGNCKEEALKHMKEINEKYDIEGETISSIKTKGIQSKEAKKASAKSTAPTAPEASTQSEPAATEESASSSPPQ